jgi:hypothetical protein
MVEAKGGAAAAAKSVEEALLAKFDFALNLIGNGGPHGDVRGWINDGERSRFEEYPGERQVLRLLGLLSGAPPPASPPPPSLPSLPA